MALGSDRDQDLQVVSKLRNRPFAQAAKRLSDRVKENEDFSKLAGRVAPVGEARRASKQPSMVPKEPEAAPQFEAWPDDPEHLRGRREGSTVRFEHLMDRHPQRTLDLHGLDRAAAKRALLRFLRTRREAGDHCVKVVVGKGLHSELGLGVLRESIGAWLTSLPAAAHVEAFVSASGPQGGAGAVMVALEGLGKDEG